MRVEAITVETTGDRATVTAEVTSPSWSQRRQLWIDVPSTFAGTGSLTAADPWIAAFLLPAMRAREELRVAAPASADLLAALPQIQTVYVDWMPSAAPIEVRADGDRVGGRGRMALRSSSRVAWTRGTRSSKPRIGARSGGPRR